MTQQQERGLLRHVGAGSGKPQAGLKDLFCLSLPPACIQQTRLQEPEVSRAFCVRHLLENLQWLFRPCREIQGDG